ENIVRTYEKQVYGIAMRVAQNTMDAEDITQEVFVIVFKKLNNFRFEAEFFSWLYRIIMNTSFNYQRSRKNYEFLDNEEDGDRQLAISDEDTSEYTDSESFQIKLKEALLQLPEKQRTVFIMKYSQHLKIREIASIVGIGEGTVKKYLFRASEKLRMHLKPYKNQLLRG
ncbi:MAG: RNA polymerase sigma factor, partial [Candidatus Marinimicrobia bacterium]|nr:RNA polymerase sigma factor [Candidatus Neomarinimicrobiota bacterium]